MRNMKSGNVFHFFLFMVTNFIVELVKDLVNIRNVLYCCVLVQRDLRFKRCRANSLPVVTGWRFGSILETNDHISLWKNNEPQIHILTKAILRCPVRLRGLLYKRKFSLYVFFWPLIRYLQEQDSRTFVICQVCSPIIRNFDNGLFGVVQLDYVSVWRESVNHTRDVLNNSMKHGAGMRNDFCCHAVDASWCFSILSCFSA